jgi:hypothetical protein
MSQTAAHLLDHVIPLVPVRQWVLSLPIPLRLLLAARPELVTPVLGVVQRVLERHLLGGSGARIAHDSRRRRVSSPRPASRHASVAASGIAAQPGSSGAAAAITVPADRNFKRPHKARQG